MGREQAPGAPGTHASPQYSPVVRGSRGDSGGASAGLDEPRWASPRAGALWLTGSRPGSVVAGGQAARGEPAERLGRQDPVAFVAEQASGHQQLAGPGARIDAQQVAQRGVPELR